MLLDKRSFACCIHTDMLKTCYHPRHAKTPPHLKIQRAKVIVDDEGKKLLTTCESCGTDVYLFWKVRHCAVSGPRRAGPVRDPRSVDDRPSASTISASSSAPTSTAPAITAQ